MGCGGINEGINGGLNEGLKSLVEVLTLSPRTLSGSKTNNKAKHITPYFVTLKGPKLTLKMNKKMNGWEKDKLDNLCKKIQSGGTPKSDRVEYYGGDIPFVTIEDITASKKYLQKTKRTITVLGLNDCAAWVVPKNSVMYSIYATIGEPLINEIEAATNQAILNIITDNQKINSEFLYYFLLNIKSEVYKYSAQTTQSNLNAAIVKSFEIAYPSLPEQTRIAQILSQADEAIAHTEALIAKYQRIKTGLMQDLLTRGIDEQGQIRSEATHPFKDSPLGRIPVEWEIVTTENLFDMMLGKMLNKDAKQGINLYPYLANKNVQWGYFDLNNLQEMTFSEYEQKKYRLKVGDLLVCEGGEVGRCAIWNSDNSSIFFQKAVHKLTPSTDRIISDYMKEYMVFITQKSFFNDFISQTSIKHFTQEKFKKLPVLLPPISEQKMIIEAFRKNDFIVETENQHLAKLQSIKRGLMQDLLSGRVRVGTPQTHTTA